MVCRLRLIAFGEILDSEIDSLGMFGLEYPIKLIVCLFSADGSLLTAIDGAHLDCVMKNHAALAPAMHLLPENVLVSGNENVPGLAASPTGKLTGKVEGQKPQWYAPLQ